MNTSTVDTVDTVDTVVLIILGILILLLLGVIAIFIYLFQDIDPFTKHHHQHQSTGIKLKNIFIKKYKSKKKKNYFQEKKAYQIVSKFPWSPRLIDFDDKHGILVTENVGEPISEDNAPSDLKQQVEKIKRDFKSINVHHNDLKFANLMVNKEGKISVIDWGHAVFGSEKENKKYLKKIDRLNVFERDRVKFKKLKKIK